MVGVTTIVSIALVRVGAVAVLSLRDEAMRISDSAVSDSLAALSYSYAKRQQGHSPSLDSGNPAVAGMPAFQVQGQAPGTVIAVLHGGSVVYAKAFGDGEPAAAPEGATRSPRR